MAASYPASLYINVVHVNVTDVIDASHVNNLENEIIALETYLGTNPQISGLRGTFATVAARIEDIATSYSLSTHTHAHSALSGLTTGDPHTQYMKGSSFAVKGDLLGGTGASSFVNLGVGTDGQVLTAASGQATGLQWTTISGVVPGAVVAATSFGLGSANGVLGTFSRADHAHGTPTHDTAAHSGLAVRPADYTAKGDVLVGTGASTYAKHAVGANSTILMADSAQTDGVKYAVVKLRIPHTWAVQGTIAVPSGETNFIPPFFVPVPATQTATLVKVRYVIHAGTSATVKLQKGGVDIGGFTALSVTTTAASTTGSVALADDDLIALVVTAVAGAPTNLSFTLEIDYTWNG